MKKRLYRSNQNKMLAGVCGGVAEYFDIDPVIVRLIWVVLALAGAGIIAYIIAMIIIPEQESDFHDRFNENEEDNSENHADDEYSNFSTYDENGSANDTQHTNCHHANSNIIFGLILIVLGVYFFLKRYFHWLNFSHTWPLILVIIGIAFIYKNRK